ncbi:XdhC family protein [Chondromyces apiculatus]|uniref:Xanthine and CO dehydrogenases maturation factor, XdhC/CoxF family n=1 Tax=Chondromyces apiculatus DSM 436 TaxID=1192034 RepID=A0A017SX51_9BACT|nr:XdhC/CoxI family protein [Chondromyces apiculatus]EYF01185.1 Xanthine and CO dehydrogenases maturation factor, XdhC/CoxF family [Chondromyces apiculatus DSM 436]
MKDAAAIASAAATLRARREPFLMATVVRVQGSSYRRPGARLIATAEGRLAGTISGGCLERDLLRTGFWRARHGPVLVRYDSQDLDEGEPVLGCGGIVEVLLEQGTAGAEDDPLALLTGVLSSDQAAALATVFQTTDRSIPLGARWALRGGSLAEASHPGHPRAPGLLDAMASASAKVLATERAACLELATDQGVVDVLVEPILPAPHVFIFGEGPDVLPLVTMARHLGWRVTVWGAPDSLGNRAHLVAAGAVVESDLEVVRGRVDASHRAMAVVMGHSLSRDREALRAALASRAVYIGVLGPRHRTASLAAEVSHGLLADPRVHAPIGLDLGAETPEEIALSIASEILARIRGASHAPLRQRETIHGGAT